MNKEELFVICSCGDMDHMFVLTCYPEDEPPELVLSIHLNPHRPWYRRIWRAITYIFGVRSKYGDFDEVLIDDRKKVRELGEFVNAAYLYHMGVFDE